MYKEYYKDLRLEDINVVDYRRQKVDTIKALEESIRFNGLINPITVEETYNGEFNLIAGYHRLQAFKRLEGVYTIPCKIRKYDISVSDRDRDLAKNITKQEENHIRQVFTPYEIAQDYIELEDAYKKRFPSYAENPVKFIERYKDKLEAKKRAEDLFNAAKTKNDKTLFQDQLKDIQKELVSIIPPSENIKNLFPNASSQDIKSAEKIAKCEKENHGLIKNLTDDNVKKTTINTVVNELTKPENVIEYLKSNRDERKDLLEQLVHKTRVSRMGLEIEKLHEDVYKVGKVKVHCITMLDKLHLVAKSQYNVRIYVENNNILSSIIESFDLEHFKVLVVFYDRKSFNNFMESFK
ncbi:hypothetical protein FC839_14560 [Clostridium botulinum]|uniref:ParB-like N-terminal domain-containing protein n=2 Tax=Clostridium botulinum TaxID=1491 RepID=A0A6B4JQ00_CLOBO|nr:ParB N-terminal domain-containing protein [Clostridium botulinum]MBY6920982.1 ParB N-terminal domain-containing protein [Clostridium botulinum]NFH69605.1 hypothetical protein [Clostridium botulinum]NFJ58980.1 hypothetical protein [Clostridium botulinum]NFL51027.1 hypothetical protein [Clostridium botulinum]